MGYYSIYHIMSQVANGNWGHEKLLDKPDYLIKRVSAAIDGTSLAYLLYLINKEGSASLNAAAPHIIHLTGYTPIVDLLEPVQLKNLQVSFYNATGAAATVQLKLDVFKKGTMYVREHEGM